MTTKFTGVLKHKSKPELLSIATALKIDLVPACRGGTPTGIRRDVLQELIKSYLEEHITRLQPQEEFVGLYQSIEAAKLRETRKAMAKASVENQKGSGNENSMEEKTVS